MTKHKPLPSQERLQQLFEYSVITGELIYRVGTKKGCAAGGGHSRISKPHEYINVRVDGSFFLAHRVIWKLVTGIDPGESLVDHADGCSTNNAWINLRLATATDNAANSSSRRGAKIPLKGVYLRYNGKYGASIRRRDHNHHLGTFPTPEEANAATGSTLSTTSVEAVERGLTSFLQHVRLTLSTCPLNPPKHNDFNHTAHTVQSFYQATPCCSLSASRY